VENGARRRSRGGRALNWLFDASDWFFEDAVDHHGMEVGVEIETAAEALLKHGHSSLAVLHSELDGTPAVRSENFFGEDAGERAEGLGVGRGASGQTRSTMTAAVLHMRRALQDGHMPRRLQEKATSRFRPQPSQTARTKPCAEMPQRR
jgi:hypothetical protein